MGRAFSAVVLRVMNELTLVDFFHFVTFCGVCHSFCFVSLSDYLIVSILYFCRRAKDSRYENFVRCTTDMLTTREQENESNLLRNGLAVPLHGDGRRAVFLTSLHIRCSFDRASCIGS